MHVEAESVGQEGKVQTQMIQIDPPSAVDELQMDPCKRKDRT